MIGKIIRNLTPPIIYKVLSLLLIKSRNDENKLFDGEDKLFKSAITNHDVYGEYGCGKSTVWVSKKFDIPIYSVESDFFWKINISKTINNNNCKIKYTNIGKVGPWGVPLDYKRCKFFHNYTDWIWRQKIKPTIILIDGRFRVCSFLTSLINGNEGAKIIFDDYNVRKHYHYVEKYIKPIKKNKRQGLFIIPPKKKLNIKKIKKSINNFRYVFS
tara:strand:- start:485 stop:1126 length:642 start_codon:yes stop_codon:yes gene_type:complete